MRRQLHILSLTCFWLLILGGCVEEYDPDLPVGQKRLVVDGRITTLPPPYVIQLSETQPLNQPVGLDTASLPTEGAEVTITDDQGNVEILTETSPGTYESSRSGMWGQVGNSYVLTIATQDGITYQSEPEEILSGPPIVGLMYRFQEEIIEADFLNGGDVDLVNEQILFQGVTPDEAGVKNLYRWDFKVIFEVQTDPAAFGIFVPNDNPELPDDFIPMPKDCCSQCWINEFSPRFFVDDDRLIDGNLFVKDLFIVNVTPFRFHRRFYAEIQQSTLSVGAFNFYKGVEDQTVNVGSIFDPAPTLLGSNITNLNDPDDVVLGYFAASEVTAFGTFIEPVDLRRGIGPWLYPDDCLTLQNSTTIRPAFWPN